MTLAPSHHSPSPAETATRTRETVGFWKRDLKIILYHKILFSHFVGNSYNGRNKVLTEEKNMRTLMTVKNLKIMLDEAALNYTTVNPSSLALCWSLDVTKERL